VVEDSDGRTARHRRGADVPQEPAMTDGAARPGPSRSADRFGTARLESTIGHVLRFGTVASSTLFAIGLLMALTGLQVTIARVMLSVGLLMLLATPVARVVVSVIEYVREGDWIFVVLTLIVLLALGGSVVAAYL
jgi:uncharacterized membrane protein